ncbi:MAG: T9SS type A sorting domain-containing protein [Chlorobi bacterium]|nr:T9SS type A sorting domain-containing protein [Chlorobiota bacterium]
MKKIDFLLLILFFAVLLTSSSYSQILNASFEDWDGGRPINWNAFISVVTNVTRTSDAQQGSSAAQMEIMNFANTAWPAMLGTVNDNSSSIPGHPVSIKYTKFKGYIKTDLKGGAVFWTSIVMYDDTDQGIGTGTFLLANPSPNWSQFEADIEYYSDKAPSYLTINFTLLDTLDGDLTSVGSTVKIDNLTLDTPTSVESNGNTPLTFALDQNYPNPFNPSTTIRYSIPNESDVSLTVFNSIGAKVAELYKGTQTAGNFEINWNASDFSSGVYFLRMNAISLKNSKNFTDIKKLILLK